MPAHLNRRSFLGAAASGAAFPVTTAEPRAAERPKTLERALTETAAIEV